VSFRWRVSSATGDTLSFAIDEVTREQVDGCGSSSFSTKSYEIDQKGSHTLKWTYAKDGDSTAGSDCGLLDDVQVSRIYAPQAPAGVVATTDESTECVSLSWEGVADAASYEIWRGVSADVSLAEMIGVTTQTVYDDTNAKSGVLYTYWVVALNLGGASEKSSAANGVRKLASPTGLQSSASTTGATISWSPVDGASAYHVYRSTLNDSSSAVVVSSINECRYVDATASPGVDFYYWIVAGSDASMSVYSAAVSGYKKLSRPGNLVVARNNAAYLVRYDSVAGAVRYWYSIGNGLKTGSTTLTTWAFDLWGNAIPRAYVEVYAVGSNGKSGEVSGANSN